jgi:uncharacterized protein YjiK
MKTALGRFALTLVLLAACGDPSAVVAQTGGRGSFATAPAQQLQLPDQLREISGLAVSPDGRLFAHDDERAVIYELDAARGAIVKRFVLGNPILTGDFEGLAITPGGMFWLTTSEGEVYRFAEGADGAHAPYHTFDSGLDELCEVEGLAYLPSEESLILACKRNKARSMRGTVSLYLWPFSGEAEEWRSLPEQEIAATAGVAEFRPSSVEMDPASGHILLLSANDAAFAELDAGGRLLSARALDRSHVQPEGVTVLPEGSLVISDEASGGRPLLTRYARVP